MTHLEVKNWKEAELEENNNLQCYLLQSSARDFYVVAYFACSGKFSTNLYSGLTLMQQSLEFHIKANLKIRNIVYPWGRDGHDLKLLLDKGMNNIVSFNKILENKKYIDFLENLTKSYYGLRYGELHLTVNLFNVLQLFDELSFIFAETFYEITKNKQSKEITIRNEILNYFKNIDPKWILLIE